MASLDHEDNANECIDLIHFLSELNLSPSDVQQISSGLKNCGFKPSVLIPLLVEEFVVNSNNHSNQRGKSFSLLSKIQKIVSDVLKTHQNNINSTMTDGRLPRMLTTKCLLEQMCNTRECINCSKGKPAIKDEELFEHFAKIPDPTLKSMLGSAVDRWCRLVSVISIVLSEPNLSALHVNQTETIYERLLPLSDEQFENFLTALSNIPTSMRTDSEASSSNVTSIPTSMNTPVELFINSLAEDTEICAGHFTDIIYAFKRMILTIPLYVINFADINTWELLKTLAALGAESFDKQSTVLQTIEASGLSARQITDALSYEHNLFELRRRFDLLCCHYSLFSCQQRTRGMGETSKHCNVATGDFNFILEFCAEKLANLIALRLDTLSTVLHLHHNLQHHAQNQQFASYAVLVRQLEADMLALLPSDRQKIVLALKSADFGSLSTFESLLESNKSSETYSAISAKKVDDFNVIFQIIE